MSSRHDSQRATTRQSKRDRSTTSAHRSEDQREHLHKAPTASTEDDLISGPHSEVKFDKHEWREAVTELAMKAGPLRLGRRQAQRLTSATPGDDKGGPDWRRKIIPSRGEGTTNYGITDVVMASEDQEKLLNSKSLPIPSVFIEPLSMLPYSNVIDHQAAASGDPMFRTAESLTQSCKYQLMRIQNKKHTLRKSTGTTTTWGSNPKETDESSDLEEAAVSETPKAIRRPERRHRHHHEGTKKKKAYVDDDDDDDGTTEAAAELASDFGDPSVFVPIRDNPIARELSKNDRFRTTCSGLLSLGFQKLPDYHAILNKDMTHFYVLYIPVGYTD